MLKNYPTTLQEGKIELAVKCVKALRAYRRISKERAIIQVCKDLNLRLADWDTLEKLVISTNIKETRP